MLPKWYLERRARVIEAQFRALQREAAGKSEPSEPSSEQPAAEREPSVRERLAAIPFTTITDAQLANLRSRVARETREEVVIEA